MSRWHKAWCTVPDIVVDGVVPKCHCCASSASADAIIVEHSNTVSSSLSIPPDEPVGQMNLHWPPGLPWSSNLASNQIDSSTVAHNATQRRERAPTSALISDPVSVISPLYRRTLNSREIRLMCLSCGEPDSPIHITLEVYEQDSCPEYETVSYTWAGEDGNSDIRKVIYAGDFWDILPQTLNCWALLQYLRPARGVRIVWVDAICINQDDVVERGLQVAKMGEIYSLCSRVVIWLGHDIITKSRGSHRPRRRFEDIHEYGSLEEIFSRRYFTRVWIMQELLLAPYTVFPFRDKDFYAGPETVKYLIASIGQERWKEIGRPWLLNLNASRHLPKEDLYNSLRKMLSPDQGATDRRDVIFGILGLIRSTNLLTPDYSLSLRDTMIGVSAYFLLELKRLEILFHAGALRTISTYPSWVPNWNTAWFQMSDTLDQNLDTRWSKDIPQGFMGIFCPRPRGSVGLGPTAPSWDLGASIDVSTASLTMNLAHFMKVPSRPLIYDSDAGAKVVGSGSGVASISSFVFSSPSCELMLYCDSIPLDEIVEPGKDHIFLVEHERNARYLLLLLREDELPGHYRLIISWSCHDLILITKKPPQDLSDHVFDSTPVRNVQFHTYVNPWRSLADAIRDVEVSGRYSPHYTHKTNRASNDCAECDQALIILEQLFPGTTWPLAFALRVFQSILDESRHAHDLRLGRLSHTLNYDESNMPLSQKFVESMRRAFGFFGHDVDDQNIVATISSRQWKDGPHGLGLWERCESQDNQSKTRIDMSNILHGSIMNDLGTETLVRLRLPLRVLFNQIRLNSRFFNAFNNIRFFKSTSMENEMDMVLNKNKLDYKAIFPHCWPKAAVEELGLYETVQEVTMW